MEVETEGNMDPPNFNSLIIVKDGLGAQLLLMKKVLANHPSPTPPLETLGEHSVASTKPALP